MSKASKITVRNTRPEDFAGIRALCRRVYPHSLSWGEEQLTSHLAVFPEGQFIAVEAGSENLVGMAASLIIFWEDYDSLESWRDFTDGGMFRNHDPQRGRTLYGAEVMTDPGRRRLGIGSALYRARRKLVETLNLRRIRAGSRLRGYHRYADRMSAETYVLKILRGELKDPTLNFQLKKGFHVFGVVPNYLPGDPESLGYAALIEWINEKCLPLDIFQEEANHYWPQMVS